MKKKAETPARPCDEITTPTVTQDTQQWFCSLCEVSTTSELTLHSHFQGKKHKSREARSIPNDTSSSVKILGSVADDSAPSSRAVGIVVPVSIVSSENGNSSASKKWECSVCQLSLSSEVLLISHLQGKKHKAKEAKFEAGEIIAKIEEFPFEKPREVFMPANNVNANDNDKHLYCSICRVSASSLNNLNDHLNGKKHKAKAGQSHQGIVSMKPEPAEKVPGVEVRKVKSFDGGDLNTQLCKGEETEQEIVIKNKESTENVSDVEVMKVESLDGGDNPTNAQKSSNLNTDLTKDGQVELDMTSAPLETKLDGNRNLVLLENSDGNKQATEESEKQGDLSMEYVKYWHCKLCNKGTPDEATMSAHRKSNEHMTLLKEHGGGLISVVTIPKEALKKEEISKEELSA